MKRGRALTAASAACMLAAALIGAAERAARAEQPQTPAAARAAEQDAAQQASAATSQARRAAAEAAARAREAAAHDQTLGRLGLSIVAREARLEKARVGLKSRRQAVTAAQLRLAASREKLKRLAAAAERVSREPTAAILVQPDRPIDAARSAMLMRRLAEKLKKQRKIERRDAKAWREAVAEAEQTETAILADLAALRAEEAEVARRRAAAQAAEQTARSRADAARERARRLSRKAKDLRSLAKALGEQRAREERRAERNRRERLAIPPAPTPRPRQEPRRKSSPGSRPEARPESPRGSTVVADRPFDQARGRLAIPAVGEMRRPRRKEDPGVAFFTPPYARVIAPWSGVVFYAGDYKSYGNVVMIEPQKGYWIFMTGLESIDVREGQRLAAGEPIGRMGGPAQQSAEFLFEQRAGATNRSERLYVEIRKNLRPLDPARWFQTKRVSDL